MIGVPVNKSEKKEIFSRVISFFGRGVVVYVSVFGTTTASKTDSREKEGEEERVQ